MGKDGSGRKLTEEEIMTSIKLHCQAVKKEEDYEILARQVGYDIEAAAQETIRQKDATQLIISLEFDMNHPMVSHKPNYQN